MSYQPGVKELYERERERSAGANQMLRVTTVFSSQSEGVGREKSKTAKYGMGVQLLHSWLETHRITINLQLTGKYRLIITSISLPAYIVT